MMKGSRIFMAILLVYIFLSGMIPKKVEDNAIQLLSQQDHFVAGEKVVLEFKGALSNAFLYYSNAYGATLASPKVKAGISYFELDPHIVNKSGTMNWELSYAKGKIKGQLTVAPQTDVVEIESYLGPGSIQVGGKDFAAYTIFPLDAMGNTLDSTKQVELSINTNEIIARRTLSLKDGFAFAKVYSTNKVGRILVASKCDETPSKEYAINVQAAFPENFVIYASRVHNFADGNQIVTLTTSKLQDKYKNTVTDGTLVEFMVMNNNGFMKKAFGTTISGVATAKLLHPDQEELWNVNALVNGVAKSNTLNLKFKQAIQDFSVRQLGSSLQIEDIKGFMGQKIPDGLLVRLAVQKDGKLFYQDTKTTVNGGITFVLNPVRFTKGNYVFTIELAGIQKTLSYMVNE